MGIFMRISEIITANLNDMVEQWEDPEQMLRLAIREMEDAIRNAKPDVAKAMANETIIAKELNANEKEVAVWSQRAVLAVEAGDDKLARKALNRKKEYEKIVVALTDEQKAAADASRTFRCQFEGMRAKLAEAERRLVTFVACKKAANILARAAEVRIDPMLEQGAFAKFDRLARKVMMAEAEADAMVELSKQEFLVSRVRSESEVSDRDCDIEIEAELLKLKDTLGNRQK